MAGYEFSVFFFCFLTLVEFDTNGSATWPPLTQRWAWKWAVRWFFRAPAERKVRRTSMKSKSEGWNARVGESDRAIMREREGGTVPWGKRSSRIATGGQKYPTSNLHSKPSFIFSLSNLPILLSHHLMLAGQIASLIFSAIKHYFLPTFLTEREFHRFPPFHLNWYREVYFSFYIFNDQSSIHNAIFFRGMYNCFRYFQDCRSKIQVCYCYVASQWNLVGVGSWLMIAS